MNKILITVIAAIMAVACSGSRQSNPYTEILEQAYAAVEEGDFEQTEKLLLKYSDWLNGLSEEETIIAEEEFTKWYEAKGAQFEAMYEKALEAYGELYL